MIYKVLEEGSWSDEKCFVIGGGPSLIGFDFNRLKDKGRIIAVNKAYYDVPFADVLIGMDPSFFRWADTGKLEKPPLGEKYRAAFRDFQGHKIIIADPPVRIPKNVYLINRIKQPKWSTSLKEGLYTGNNSGAGALAFALIMGCDPIYLLGIDGRHTKKAHYHSGYPNRAQTPKTAKSFIKHFEYLGREAKKKKISIYNCSMISSVNCFERKTIEEVINNG
jgi:hypothetical protein